METSRYNEDLDVDKKIREGGVWGKIYLGVQGNDVEASKLAMKTMIDTRLSKEENINLLEINMYDILKDDRSDLFSGVTEVEFVADSFRWFANIIMRYGPSAIEIIEPDHVKLDMSEMHSIVADIADFSHMYSQQIIAMLNNPERKALFDKMLNDKK